MSTIYQLKCAPGEHDGEGEDHDEWFSSLTVAKHRRAELIRENPKLEGHRYGSDFAIYQHTLKKLSFHKLLIMMLNNKQSGLEDSKVIVPEYSPNRKHILSE